MRALRIQLGTKRALLSSIAGISVVLTAVKGFQSWKQNPESSCKDSRSMSCSASCTQPNKLGLLLADFDQTCTTHDTTELYYRASQKYQNGSADEKLILDEKWKKVTNKYLTEYRDQISESLSKFIKSEPNEFDQKGLHAFLNEIAAFNRKASIDVDESKLICGVDNTGLKLAADQVQLYPGCFDVINSIVSRVRIVSVNWSSEMINFVFQGIIPKEFIYANMLLDKNGLSSGLIGREMISSFDKVKIVQKIINEDHTNGISVFVGDSITDLLSMLETDLGIIVGDSKTILQVAKAFGINVEPLGHVFKQGHLSLECRAAESKNPIIYSAKDWFEIKKFVQYF